MAKHTIEMREEDEMQIVFPDGTTVAVGLESAEDEDSFPEMAICLPNIMTANVWDGEKNTIADGTRIYIPITRE